jgi:phage shock protein PspC (stress-responsive transcriptional regulator)
MGIIITVAVFIAFIVIFLILATLMPENEEKSGEREESEE